MKAFEARQKSLKNQFEWIEKKIKKAIEKGESQIIVKKTPLYEEVIEKLLDDGFDILIIQDSAGAFTRISMLASEEVRCGRFDYVPIEWEVECSDEVDNEEEESDFSDDEEKENCDDGTEKCNFKEKYPFLYEEVNVDSSEVSEESNKDETSASISDEKDGDEQM